MFKPLLKRAFATKNNPVRVGVLVSGGGTNLQALIDFTASEKCHYNLNLVLASNPNIGAIDKARCANIPCESILWQNFSSREDYESEMLKHLHNAKIELVVLAGYMRVLSKTFLNAYQDKVINVHPSLLPSFNGLRASKKAIELGVRVSGCTVHLVNEGVDTGPIIDQYPVRVFENDNESTLHARIQAAEHHLLPKVVEQIARGEVLFDKKRIRVSALK